MFKIIRTSEYERLKAIEADAYALFDHSVCTRLLLLLRLKMLFKTLGLGAMHEYQVPEKHSVGGSTKRPFIPQPTRQG